MSKLRVPDDQRRVLLFGRVDPRTKEFLESLGEPNYGRAVDRLVIMHKAIMKLVKPEARMEIEPLAPLPTIFQDRA